MVVRDGDWILYDHDFATGCTVWRRDNGDGTSTIRHDYRVDDVIDQAARIRQHATDDWKDDWHQVAKVPIGIYFDQLAEASKQGDDKFIARFLNDSDHAKFRTKGGRL